MRFSRAVLLYTGGVLAVGLCLLAFSLWRFPLGGDLVHWLLFLTFALLAALTDRYGLHLTQGTQVHVDTIPLFAGVLLFNPAVALVIATFGRVFGRVGRRMAIAERAFNLGQTLIYVGAGALVRSGMTETPWVPDGVSSWLSLVLAVAAMYLLNTAIVAGVVAVEHRAPFFSVWTSNVPLDVVEQSVSFAFGLLTALVVVPYPWGLLLVAVPSITVFVTLDRTLKMEAKQKQLAETNSELATHLSKQAEQLRDAYAVLEDALDAKNQMLQNVSHELRTPMVAVSGYLEALQDGLYGELSPNQLPALDIMMRNTNTMIRLVNDLLSLQSLDRGQLQLSWVELPDVFQNCLETFAQRASAAGIELEAECYDDVPSVRADAERLEQVIGNLVDNAIKFSPNGGRITLQAERVNHTGVQISVADQGIGIPADELPHIYRRFYQVDGSRTRKFGGQGLGLAIAKRIVELHGGTIRAESQVGAGTVFYIMLGVEETGGGVGGNALA